jgi:ankyrin repeat protein
MEPYDLDVMTAEDIRSYRGHKHYSLVHIVCFNGWADDLKMMIQIGVDLNVPDPEGWTPLHFAAFHLHFDCIELLLVHGADLRIRNRIGDTPAQLVEHEGLREWMEGLARHQRSIVFLVHALTKKDSLAEIGLVRGIHEMLCESTSSLRRQLTQQP